MPLKIPASLENLTCHLQLASAPFFTGKEVELVLRTFEKYASSPW
jgi:hypothetical protein